MTSHYPYPYKIWGVTNMISLVELSLESEDETGIDMMKIIRLLIIHQVYRTSTSAKMVHFVGWRWSSLHRMSLLLCSVGRMPSIDCFCELILHLHCSKDEGDTPFTTCIFMRLVARFIPVCCSFDTQVCKENSPLAIHIAFPLFYLETLVNSDIVV